MQSDFSLARSVALILSIPITFNFDDIYAAKETGSDGGGHKTSCAEKIHRHREAIQHDSYFLDSVYDT
jgi:hypothetical protein